MLRNRYFWSIVLLLLMVTLFIRLAGPRLAWVTSTTPWQETARGIEVRTLRGWSVGGWFTVTAARADVSRCAIHIVDAHHGVRDAGSTAREVCPPEGAAINANFFDVDTLDPLGLLVVNTKQVSPYKPGAGWWAGRWGFFLLQDAAPKLLEATPQLPPCTTEAVQCGPRLVINGIIPAFASRPAARRTAVGLDGQGRMILAVADGDVTFAQWAYCLRGHLGCIDALNLDGGPSAQLAVRGRRTIDVEVGETVPVFITVSPRASR